MKRYDHYKNTDIDWIGRIPEHWQTAKLKNCFQIVSGSTPSSDNEKYWNGDIVWLTPTDLNQPATLLKIGDSQRKITSEGLASCGTTLVPAGSIVLSTRAPIGSLGITTKKASTNQGCKSLVPKSQSHPIFYGYLLNIATDQLNNLGKGTTFLELSSNELGRFKITRPPLEEQIKISSFINHETTKIDTLINEQKHLIELLKEKRQAVISHAVTKGLNPNVPMKDSGVEWLGMVPQHWAIRPIKQIVAIPITDGPHETPQFLDEGIDFISAEAVSSGKIDFSKKRGHISEEDNAKYSLKYTPKIYDIYMVKSGATTGITAMVEERADFNIWSPLAVIRCGNNVKPHFMLNYMRSKNFIEAITLNWSYGTQQNIGMGVIENLACSIPPASEQSKIIDFLSKETLKLANLICQAEQAIRLLQERRSALISAAVTGKIDV